MKQWYEKLFENYALGYDQEAFTRGTIQEVDFLEQEIAFNTSLKVLDIGCGTGQHAIELARRGYAVTGVDSEITQLGQTPVESKDFAGWSAKITTAGTRRYSDHAQKQFAELI